VDCEESRGEPQRMFVRESVKLHIPQREQLPRNRRRYWKQRDCECDSAPRVGTCDGSYDRHGIRGGGADGRRVAGAVDRRR